MLTDYNPIAERYKKAKQQPWRTCIERPTLLGLLGDLHGRSVVDLACGEGFYTRLIRGLGAAPVVGVDLSEGMIELARQQEALEPQGIDYRVGDVKEFACDELFDFAAAAYLLNYARDRQELTAMCAGVARLVKPGGRFVTVNTSPSFNFADMPSFAPYGFEIRLEGPLVEGTPITWTFQLDDGPLSVENYYLDQAAHDEALRAAGFREVRWHAPRLAAGSEGSEFWQPMLDRCPLAFLECVK